MLCETWTAAFPGLIPHEEYRMDLRLGEKQGLIINLLGQINTVTLDFGNVHAVNILDEGVNLADPPGVIFQNRAELHLTGFPDTLYLVENGGYAAYIKACMSADLYEALDLRQYSLVTLNYVTEIICSAEPTVKISSN